MAFRETLRGREPEPEAADDAVAALCSELRVQQSSAEQCSSGAAVPLSGHKWMCNHEHDRSQKRSLEDMSKLTVCVNIIRNRRQGTESC